MVLGADPIGQACLLAALRLGAGHVLVSEPNPSRTALVPRLGSDQVTADDPVRQRLTDVELDVLGGKPTLVLDAVGSGATRRDAFDVADRPARIVLVGMNEPRVQLSAYAVSTSERVLIGAFCYNRNDIDTRDGRAVASGCFLRYVNITENRPLGISESLAETLSANARIPAEAGTSSRYTTLGYSTATRRERRSNNFTSSRGF